MYSIKLPLPAIRCLALLLVAGCAYQDSHVAQSAQQGLIGVSKADLDMCAGLPTKSERIDNTTEMRSYERSAETNSGINLTFPVIGGGVAIGAGGYCHATFKLVDGRVTELRYSGETSELGLPNGVCAPIVRGCVVQPVRHAEAPPPPQQQRAVQPEPFVASER
jgi:hypothetical protein